MSSHDHTHVHTHSHTPEHATKKVFNHEKDLTEEESAQMEKDHFDNVVKAFRNYERDTLSLINMMQESYDSLPKEQQEMIPNVNSRLIYYRSAARMNQKVFDRANQKLFNIDSDSSQPSSADAPEEPTLERDADKLRSTLRQCVRDWCDDGKKERERCYKPILDIVQKYFPINRENVSILVPGCGLGRLAWEFAHLGYRSQGNEFSFMMLLMSNVLLNQCAKDELLIYPYIHSINNVRRNNDTLISARLPDVDTSDLPSEGLFSMVAGDFVEVYGTSENQNQWDCVATCFFIDTAHNIIDYIKVIRDMLKPGGIWVNLGPLLYHYANMEGEKSIELTLEELKSVIGKFGFQFEHDEMRDCPYTSVRRSMLSYTYHCAFFVCKKM